MRRQRRYISSWAIARTFAMLVEFMTTLQQAPRSTSPSASTENRCTDHFIQIMVDEQDSALIFRNAWSHTTNIIADKDTIHENVSI